MRGSVLLNPPVQASYCRNLSCAYCKTMHLSHTSRLQYCLLIQRDAIHCHSFFSSFCEKYFPLPDRVKPFTKLTMLILTLLFPPSAPVEVSYRASHVESITLIVTEMSTNKKKSHSQVEKEKTFQHSWKHDEHQDYICTIFCAKGNKEKPEMSLQEAS